MGYTLRKQRDPRQLPLPSPQGDGSPEFEMKPVLIPPLVTEQPELFQLPQPILCVKAPPHPGKTAPVPNLDFFPWPTTTAPIGNGHVANADWPETGLLRYFGYAVGVNGKLKSHRQAILKRVFELDVIPNLVSPAYVAEWGSGCSSARLKKMAESIASFCRNDKRRQRAIMNRAIENYEKDLAWLKETYYDGRFDERFRWPTT